MRVFISYAREDMVFADKLARSLEENGLTVLMDRKDIPPLELWQKEIRKLVKRCDAVVAILSPNSLGSAMCRWEAKLSEELHKRLAPISIDSVAIERAPAQIQQVQVLPFGTAATFDDDLDRLVQSLKRDAAWLELSSRITMLAERWLELDKPDTHCLRDKELREATRWRSHRPKDAPPLSKLQERFIQRSRYLTSWRYWFFTSVRRRILAALQTEFARGALVGALVMFLAMAFVFPRVRDVAAALAAASGVLDPSPPCQ